MHQYIETVRSEIESASGEESYLSSTLFLRMFRELKYEDEGELKISDKEGFENIQHKAMNSISTNQDYNVKDEVLAWQIAILRDIAKDFYYWWIDYKDEKFRADDCFSDGESCIALEASCEKINENPTDAFTKLLEVEFVLTRLSTSCNTVGIEMDDYWQFKYKNKKNAPENSFTHKRIELESARTYISQAIEELKKVSKMCKTFARQLAGSEHLLWMNPHHMLESLIHTLRGYLEFEYIEESDVSLSKWLDELFPERLSDRTPNPTFQSGLHHKIIANLSQATQCMVQETVKKNDAFSQRDEIMRPFFYEVLEKVKIVELQNLNLNKDDVKKEFNG